MMKKSAAMEKFLLLIHVTHESICGFCNLKNKFSSFRLL